MDSGCSEQVLLGAIREIAETELLIPPEPREMLKVSGILPMEMRSQAKRMPEAARFLRRVIQSRLFTPLPLGLEEDYAWLVSLRSALDAAALRMYNWPPKRLLRFKRTLPRAALVYKAATGKHHYREIAELLQAAYSAFGKEYSPTKEEIRKYAKQVQQESPHAIQRLLEDWGMRFHPMYSCCCEPPAI